MNFLLDMYRLGFNAELNGTFNKNIVGSVLEKRAYSLGSIHALLGDEQAKFDYLTDEELIKEITKYEKP